MMRAGVTPELATELRQVAHDLADAARSAVAGLFRTPLHSVNKAAIGYDPVTEADRAAETAMRRILAERRPDDGILGEEYGLTQGQSGLVWVLDPIDGTRAFLSGAPTWGVLIAVSDAQGPLYGIIDQPHIGERFEGGLGYAAVTGPRPAELRTRDVPLSKARLFTTFPEIGTAADRAAFSRVAAQVELTRYGLDCYAYALLAAGHVDLVIEAGLNPYDIAAPIAVIEAAGGVVTDWTGGPAHQGGRVIAAGSPELHAAALELLRADHS